jgi:hypothetical protein
MGGREVMRDRPTDLSDAYWTGPTTKIDETFGYQLAGESETLFPTFEDTRTVPAAASPARC